MALPAGQLEWLETNPLGSFCLACVDRKLRRKYHALLTVRDPGRGDPWNLLAETREILLVGAESVCLAEPSAADDPRSTLMSFSATPRATHVYAALGIEIERSVRLGASDQVELSYRVRKLPRDAAPLRLVLEPLLRCRPLHELAHENPFLDGTCVKLGDEVRMLPYAGMPAVALRVFGAEAAFEERGTWWSVHYPWEVERGYPARESLFAPGRFTIELREDLTFTFVVGLHRVERPASEERAVSSAVRDLKGSPTSSEPKASLAHAATQFFANTQQGLGLLAGYPWFSLRSRDALMALPGVYLATGSWEQAEQVLASLAKSRAQGLIRKLPAALGPEGDSPCVMASLLFARTVQWFAAQLGDARVAGLMPIVCELLESLSEGGDPRVRFERGVSVYCEPGPHALSWMDARVDGRPVTPRHGYTVELDALAYNAVHFACTWADAKRPGFARTFRNRLRNAEGEFLVRYWDDARGYLADTFEEEWADTRLRPNQLWALALPYRPISGSMAQAALSALTRELWTPLGLRTLSPQDPDYRGSFGGDEPSRERAYHQGSVFPALTGLFADATLAIAGRNALIEQLTPMFARIAEHVSSEGCVGQVSELFDGDAPHRAGGAPAFACSVAELYRAQLLLEEVAARSESPVVSGMAAKRTVPSKRHDGETVSK